MNVLLISPMPPEIDGLAPYAAKLRDAYTRAGHEVETIATGRAGAASVAASSLRPRALFARHRLLARMRPELVHVQHTISAYGVELPALWAFILVARLLGSSVVITHHEVTRDITRLKLIARIYYGVVSRMGTAVHVHTGEAARTLIERAWLPASRILVSPHPVFDAPPADSEPMRAARLLERYDLADRRILLHFGFIHVEKGIDRSIEAYAELLRRRPDLTSSTRLVIAGGVRPRPTGFARFEEADQAYAQLLHDLVARHGLEANVIFVGRVPDDDVMVWMRAAALVLLPYERSEQSGVANLAIAADTPVLATRLPGLAELLDGLPMIDNVDAGPYSELLQTALDHPEVLRTAAATTYRRARLVGGVDQLAAAVARLAEPSRRSSTTLDREAA